jgi:hypothetical protein
LGIVGVAYVQTHPLVFNESLWSHAHCIKAAGLTLDGYAQDHGGKFPYDVKGYGNALLILPEECYHTLTGPGYDTDAFHEAKRTGGVLHEDDCGRVYIQGLTTKSNHQIALLFDKVPTPGGDHCHFPTRLWAPLGREVWLVGCHQEFVPESAWPDFASKQVELLVKEGFDRQVAVRLFTPQPR